MKKIIYISAMIIAAAFCGCSDSDDKDDKDLPGSGKDTDKTEYYIYNLNDYYSPKKWGELTGTISDIWDPNSLYIKNNVDSDGRYKGELCGFSPNMYIIRILNSNTLIKDCCYLYAFNYYFGDGELVFWLYHSPLVYVLENPTYYTYIKSDNRLILSNGDIFIIRGDELIQSGDSTPYTKYAPN